MRRPRTLFPCRWGWTRLIAGGRGGPHIYDLVLRFKRGKSRAGGGGGDLREQGVFARDTLVWAEGMTGWVTWERSSLAGAAPVEGPVVVIQHCVDCGKAFPEGERLRYENAWVCAACKPLFFQRLKEGVDAPGKGVTMRSRVKPASVRERFAAVFIDGIIFGFAVVLPFVVIASFLAPGWIPYYRVLFYIVAPIYEIVMIGTYGATLGKMAMKIKVTRLDGSRISYLRSIGRHYAKLLSALILYIGYLMALGGQGHARLARLHRRNPRRPRRAALSFVLSYIIPALT